MQNLILIGLLSLFAQNSLAANCIDLTGTYLNKTTQEELKILQKDCLQITLSSSSPGSLRGSPFTEVYFTDGLLHLNSDKTIFKKSTISDKAFTTQDFEDAQGTVTASYQFVYTLISMNNSVYLVRRINEIGTPPVNQYFIKQ